MAHHQLAAAHHATAVTRLRLPASAAPALLLVAVVTVAAATTAATVLVSACSPPLPDPPRVGDLVRNLSRYSGRQVTMVLEYGQRPGAADTVPPLFTRSDAYLHDATGTILVTGAWQAWNRWKSDGVFESDSIRITAGGVWTVTGRVRVAPGNLLYLEIKP